MQLSDLKNLSTQEKLQAIEVLWDALCHEDSNVVPSPIWHNLELKLRNDAWLAGEQQVSSWHDAKQRIRTVTEKK